MEKKQGDKQTEEQAADKPTEPTTSASTGTPAQESGTAETSTSSKASGGRSSSRRSRRGKGGGSASSSAAPKSGAADKASAKPAAGDDKPAAKGDAGGNRGAGKGASTVAGSSSSSGSGPRSSRALPWLVAAVALLFALAAVGGWQLWQLDQKRQAQSEASRADQQQLADRLESISGQLADTRAAIDTLEQRDEAIRQEVESSLSGQLDQLAERQDSLDQRVASIDDRLARGEIAWKTAEVGFLLTRAQERLVIARDPDGAMLALKLADERVAALSRPHWLPLRSAISDAIASIEAAGEGDRVGQALALRRQADRVDEWPLAGRDVPADEQPTADASADAGSALPADAAWYEKAWAASTGWLSRQVSVTRSDTPVRLRERVATDREMRLWLSAVRESLLSRDREALTATLDEAGDWLEAHYAVDASGPAATLEAIDQIRSRFTSRDFPSLDAVLRAWDRASAHEKARTDETGKEAQS
jgi:uroporphyrin-3 C-methyltransferase